MYTYQQILEYNKRIEEQAHIENQSFFQNRLPKDQEWFNGCTTFQIRPPQEQEWLNACTTFQIRPPQEQEWANLTNTFMPRPFHNAKSKEVNPLIHLPQRRINKSEKLHPSTYPKLIKKRDKKALSKVQNLLYATCKPSEITLTPNSNSTHPRRFPLYCISRTFRDPSNHLNQPNSSPTFTQEDDQDSDIETVEDAVEKCHNDLSQLLQDLRTEKNFREVYPDMKFEEDLGRRAQIRFCVALYVEQKVNEYRHKRIVHKWKLQEERRKEEEIQKSLEDS